MAHFRAVIQGVRGEASRLGSKGSGIRTSTDGWTCGITVRGRVSSTTPTGRDCSEFDVFSINVTMGSAYSGSSQGYIGEARDGIFYPSEDVKTRIIHEYQMGLTPCKCATGGR